MMNYRIAEIGLDLEARVAIGKVPNDAKFLGVRADPTDPTGSLLVAYLTAGAPTQNVTFTTIPVNGTEFLPHSAKLVGSVELPRGPVFVFATVG